MESETAGGGAAELGEVTWRSSGSGGTAGAGIEVAVLPDGGVALRNSADPSGPVLVYTRDEIKAFFEGVKSGEFDDLAAGRSEPTNPRRSAPNTLCCPVVVAERDPGQPRTA